MTETLILANATLVLPGETRRGALVLRDGMIADISTGSAVPAGALDCEGDLVAPGLIELHTDNLERHMSPRPSVDWPHAKAILAHDAELAGVGITTVFDAMRVGSITSNERARYGRYARRMANEILEMRARNLLKISHFLHLRAEICSETLIDEMGEFEASDRVGIVSLMDHTPGQRQFRDISKLKIYLVGKFSFSDAEFDAHVAHLYGLQDRFGAAHEAAAVLAANRYGAVLASHDDTTAEQVQTSGAHGVRIAEFPTTLEAAAACRSQGIAVMMGAPNLIRGGSHSGNIAAQSLADQGLLDICSSDYVPSSLLHAGLRLGQILGDIGKGLASVTSAPARAVGLSDRGALKSGLRGDLIRISNPSGDAAVRGVWVKGMRVA